MEPAPQPAVAGGQEALGLAVDGRGGVDVGQREGQGLEPVDETGGQLVAVTDPAGGQVLLVDLVERAGRRSAAPGRAT